MNDLLNAVITITGVTRKVASDGTDFYKITGDNGATYNLFTTKKDGSESSAYRYLKSLENSGLGVRVQVGYAENSYVSNGRTVASKNIRMMARAVEGDETISYTAPANTRMKTPVKNSQGQDVNWDEIAWGKCKHAYLLSAWEHYLSLEGEKRGRWNWDTIEDATEQLADRSVRHKRLNEPPAIEVEPEEEEINVKDIPF